MPIKNKISIAFALFATAAAQLSSEYLPPNAGAIADVSEFSVAASAPAPEALFSVESFDSEAASAPAHSFSEDDGYRYKTQRHRVIRRQRRDVATEYLPPAASTPSAVYDAPTALYSAPVETYSAPIESEYFTPAETYDVEASSPAHSFSNDDGYRYKTQRRVVKISIAFALFATAAAQLNNEYLPPNTGAIADVSGFSVAASAPAPEALFSVESFDSEAASAPAHSFSEDDGYRYKTQRHRVIRRQRRDVATEYLPPAASTPSAVYDAPTALYSAPVETYSTPVESEYSTPSETYDVEASAPAHSFSNDDGYRYKTQRRVVVRRNRY
ncbi:uncharacterized protein LOC142235866 [Haematobia irritans]|uniref:uncharacterized protein LOC142235866 n=1 Tax=Haematobia irritans TaxID=7368 RepID=UPI003F501CFD